MSVPSILNAESSPTQETSRPNIVLILVDDMGWSDLGAYGGEIHTPNIDRLAENGLRFTNFYNASKCFPSRSCLLTGAYAQKTGTSKAPSTIQHATTLGEVLKAAGYTTLVSGKHHGKDNLYDRGFDHFYGLRDGACNHFNPGLQRDGEPAPARKGYGRFWADDKLVFSTTDPMYQSYFPEDFYSTDAFTDKALEYLDKDVSADTPFFLYLAYTAPHDPIMARSEDIQKYEGIYEKGYECIRQARYERQKEMGLIDPATCALSDPTYPAWNSLSDEEQLDQARRMQVYAAMIDRVDQSVGRILEHLEAIGVADNTLILFCSDNGSSAENTSKGDLSAQIGGIDRYASLQKDWANVSNTPLRYFKNYSYEGGVRTPLIAYWPAGIVNPGRFVNQPGHFVDFMATFIELAGASYPQSVNGETIVDLDGKSFAPTLFDHSCPDRGPIYFDWKGGEAMIDWPWKLVKKSGGEWELYNLAGDGSETQNLAGVYPNKAHSMISSYDKWLDGTNIEPSP